MRLKFIRIYLSIGAIAGFQLDAASAQVPSPPKLSKGPAAFVAPQPQMPEQARIAGHHGTVQLTGTLKADGVLTDVSVKAASGSTLLDQAALSGIKLWKFTPALDESGSPVTMQITIPIEFYSFKTPTAASTTTIASNGWLTLNGTRRIFPTLRRTNFI
jgi:TonB family protein